MVRVCVGCWHLMTWCSLRITCWPRFCLVFRGSKGTVRHPGKAAFLEQVRLRFRWCSGTQ